MSSKNTMSPTSLWPPPTLEPAILTPGATIRLSGPLMDTSAPVGSNNIYSIPPQTCFEFTYELEDTIKRLMKCPSFTPTQVVIVVSLSSEPNSHTIWNMQLVQDKWLANSQHGHNHVLHNLWSSYEYLIYFFIKGHIGPPSPPKLNNVDNWT